MPDALPVLVAGGGPVGLALAIELGHRGVPCLLFERKHGTTEEPKCTLTNARSMEHFRRLGVAGAIRDAGIPGDYPHHIVFCTRIFGVEICRFAYPSRDELERAGPGVQGAFASEHAAELPQRTSQIFLEPVLKRAAESYPTNVVRFGWQVERVGQDEGGAWLEASERDSGRCETFRGSHLAACDGAGSRIRESLGIGMLGSEPTSQQLGIFFRSAELRRRTPLGDAIFYFVANPEVRGVAVAIDGRDLYTFHIVRPVDFDVTRLDPADVLRRAAGGDFDFEILAQSPWAAPVKVAERFAEGRIFLAGDSAHTFVPTGGLGMNTGIGDAVDLGWKLAACHQGWGGARLLESYEIERRPVGERNTDQARANAEALGRQPVPAEIEDPGPDGERLRRLVGAVILERQRMEFESAGVQLGYRYDPSPIVESDGSDPPADDTIRYVPTARPGSRAPHFPLGGGEVLYDRFGPGFTLLRLGPKPADTRALVAAARKRGLPLDVVTRSDPALRELYAADLSLIRPDQHVAWRASTPAPLPLELVDRVRGA